jgi:hypothetical protein
MRKPPDGMSAIDEEFVGMLNRERLDQAIEYIKGAMIYEITQTTSFAPDARRAGSSLMPFPRTEYRRA